LVALVWLVAPLLGSLFWSGVELVWPAVLEFEVPVCGLVVPVSWATIHEPARSRVANIIHLDFITASKRIFTRTTRQCGV
jgi:hypothetical protein